MQFPVNIKTNGCQKFIILTEIQIFLYSELQRFMHVLNSQPY
jgi:hypothetical protein